MNAPDGTTPTHRPTREFNGSDLRAARFSLASRGFDVDEVLCFLGDLALEWDRMSNALASQQGRLTSHDGATADEVLAEAERILTETQQASAALIAETKRIASDLLQRARDESGRGNGQGE